MGFGSSWPREESSLRIITGVKIKGSFLVRFFGVDEHHPSLHHPHHTRVSIPSSNGEKEGVRLALGLLVWFIAQWFCFSCLGLNRMDRLAWTCIAIVFVIFFYPLLARVFYSLWNDIRFSWVMVMGLRSAGFMDTWLGWNWRILASIFYSRGFDFFVNPGRVFLFCDTFIEG